MKRLFVSELFILLLSAVECSIFYLLYASTEMERSILLLLCFMTVVLHLLWAVLAFLKNKGFWQSVEIAGADFLWQRGEAVHIDETLDEAHGAKERLCAAAIENVCASTRSVLSEADQDMKNYRDYVETWVHEAKTPIAAAKLNCENNPSETTHKIMLELDQIDSYIDQALFYARMTTLDRDYLIRELNLQDVVKDVISSTARQLIHAKMRVTLEESLNTKIYSDQKWLRFMLSQCIGNAIKYRDPEKEVHEIVLSAHIENAKTAQEHCVLTIYDNGIGVDAADISRVFDKGFVGQNGRKKTQEKSTGLGLYLAAGIAKRLSLGLSANSRAGEFFQVSITFPTRENIL